jgi:hypothetical protein
MNLTVISNVVGNVVVVEYVTKKGSCKILEEARSEWKEGKGS